MAAKVVDYSSVEPSSGQSATSVSPSSVVAASSPKVSRFGKKSGFVIPKNKLSGSLVPVFRGAAKVGSDNTVKEEGAKQVQRKTKWGPDLTQDATVRKGRSVAYQTRVEQITQLLKSGALETGADQGSQSHKDDSENQSTTDHVNQEAQKFELLELERREIIGEILRLNPSYKAPSDYKPLLKVGKVPIPVKEYPGYNFIGLLLGPESNTQKRLEEETGAKIRVYGIQANAKEKRELTQSDIVEAQCSYEDLYVNVTADTYEKVDAAVALIELLVTPVSGNAAVALKNSTSVAGDVNADQSQKNPAGYMMMPMADVNQGTTQPMLVSAQLGQMQFQQRYASPWFPVAPLNAPSQPSSGFMPLPMPSNPIRFPQSPSGPPNMSPYFGQPSPFSSVPRAPLPHLPMQAGQQPLLNQAAPPQNNSMPGQRPLLVYPVMLSQPSSTAPALVPASRPSFTVTTLPTRPPASMNLQPGSMSQPTLPATTGWSTAPPAGPHQLRPNMPQMALSSSNLPLRPQHPGPPMPNNVSRPPSANFAPNFASQPSSAPPFTSAPPQVGPVAAPPVVSTSGSPLLLPVPPPSLNMPPPVPRPSPVASVTPASMPRPYIPQSAPIGAQAMGPPQPAGHVMTRPPMQTPSLAPRPPMHPPVQPPQLPLAVTGLASGTMPSFSPGQPPISSSVSATPVQAPKPLRPTFGDFTFQPQRAQVPASPTTPGHTSTSVVQNTSPVPLAAPQPPSFRPALQSPSAPVGMQSFPQPLSVNQASQAPVPSPWASFPNSTIIRPPPSFQPVAPVPQMGPPNFSPAPHRPNFTGAMPAPSVNLLLQQHTQLPPPNRPGGLMIPNQQLASSNPLAGNQTYDPFSPTSITQASPQVANAKTRKPETDQEYEDLMASFGVK